MRARLVFQVILAVGLLLPASAEETTAAPILVTAEDRLAQRVGQAVTISGTVSNLGQTSSGSIRFINFEDTNFTVIVRAANVDALEKALGATLEASLKGKPLVLHGTITSYRSKPQMELSSATQLTGATDTPTTASPTPAPSTPTPDPAAPADEILRARDDSKFKRELKRDDLRWIAVEGKVAEIRSFGSINLIQFEQGEFAATVFGSDEVKVAASLGPEARGTLEYLVGRDIRVLGYLEDYKGKPQMKLREGNQIQLDWEDKK